MTSTRTHTKAIPPATLQFLSGFNACSLNLMFVLNVFFPQTDIAVGAPNDDGGSGKVYIYHGSAQGIITSPAQVGFCLEVLQLHINSLFPASLRFNHAKLR